MDRMMEAQGGRCFYCRKPMRRDVRARHPDRATIEHRVPVSDGGSDRDGNIVAACRACNARKGWRTEDAFRREIQIAGDRGATGTRPSLADLDVDPIDRAAVSKAEMDHWHVVLEMLRARSREVFLLSTVDRLSYPEIAGTLRMTVRCVRRHMVKVIAHLDRHPFKG